MTNPIRSVLLCAAMAAAIASPAHALNVLTTFDQANGEDAFAPPIQGADGNLYGTTVYGGKSNHGTFYKMSLKGRHKVLYSFCALVNCTDGTYPAWITQAADSDFYGQTYQGGTAGAGTIFKLTADGKLTTLYSFCSQANCTDGALPQSALVQTADGTFYGTTVIGGANNQGTIFKFSPGAGLTTLYNFCSKAGCTDGAQPNIGLTLASDGNFYGTAALGGKAGPCQYGCGTVFRLTPGGKLKTIYTFCGLTNCADGSIPQGRMVEGRHGDLYGTTDGGGTANAGTAFKISPKGKLTTLHSFCSGNCADGLIPYAGLIVAADGNFYGTTNLGGPGNYGTVYKMAPGGAVTTMFGFDGGANGGVLAASLLQASDGMLYGGTQEGGDDNCYSPNGCGVLFRLSAKSDEIVSDRVVGGSVADAANAARRVSRMFPASLLGADRPTQP